MDDAAILKKIRAAIRDGQFVFTDHALEEADEDNLWAEDIIDVLLNGSLDSIYTHDPRGTRYVVRGDVGALEVDVVCRFIRDERLLVITVYVVD